VHGQSNTNQVLRYGYLQTYKAHMDTLGDELSGPRVATVLLYLSGESYLALQKREKRVKSSEQLQVAASTQP